MPFYSLKCWRKRTVGAVRSVIRNRKPLKQALFLVPQMYSFCKSSDILPTTAGVYVKDCTKEEVNPQISVHVTNLATKLSINTCLKLISAIHHTGEFEAGHYIACVQHGGEWHHCNCIQCSTHSNRSGVGLCVGVKS